MKHYRYSKNSAFSKSVRPDLAAVRLLSWTEKILVKHLEHSFKVWYSNGNSDLALYPTIKVLDQSELKAFTKKI